MEYYLLIKRMKILLFTMTWMDLKGIMLSEMSDRDGTSLVVQWLRLCSSTSGGLSSIPSHGTKISHATWHDQKNKKKKSHVWLFATRWTVARQVPLSIGVSRQEYWSGLPCPPPGELPDPGIKPASPAAPALQAGSLSLSYLGSPLSLIYGI